MPNGTFRSVLLLYYEGGGLDEFWYTNIPATRNILVYYNSLLAGVVNPYPIIYTGGINLFWWRPVTSINTLAFETPQYIELTPLLATSTKPNITVTVSNLLASAQELGSTALSWTPS
ncbi:peptide-N4-asparagine amidase [Sulfolobus acidocaldarius]|uniref:peptide-N4-asparagine amidase n=1 Tax=Sulfolobus acidocaldarius TaxID=2285 RepID=UPI0018C5BE37|nr:peptide-N4-asparagine amidase [Sulfolobus acidocaldarius]